MIILVEPEHHFDEKEAGLIMLGTILFCTVAGLGIGVFFTQPILGGLGGAIFGIILGIWLVPRLLEERG